MNVLSLMYPCIQHFSTLVTNVQETGGKSLEGSWIKRLFRNRIELRVRGCAKANNVICVLMCWIHGYIAPLLTHWAQCSLVHGFAALQHRAPVNRCRDAQTRWVHLNQGGGGGPSSPMVRLRRHHKLRENFFKFKKPIGSTILTLHQQNHCVTIHSTMKQAPTSFVGTVVTDEPQIPNWLSVPEPTSSNPSTTSLPSKAARELLHLQYENMFENFIEQVYRGRSLKSLVDDDPRLVSYEDFLRWIKRDAQRNERFKEAQEMRTEFIAGEIIEIADGVESMDPSSPDTVNRDKLRIDTRKWLMSAHNRKRYGETKQIELGGTISITEALAQAQMRVIEAEVIDVADVTPRLENDND